MPEFTALRHMMPEFTIALAIGLVMGFVLGYGVRAIISYRHRRQDGDHTFLKLSSSDAHVPAARPVTPVRLPSRFPLPLARRWFRIDGPSKRAGKPLRLKNHEEIVPARQTSPYERGRVGGQVRNNTGPDLISLHVIFWRDRKCARSPICLAASLA